NPRLADFLIRIAADGSAKLPVRVLPVIAERGGPSQAPGSVAAVAAWTTWVTDRVRAGHEVADPQAEAIGKAVALSDGTERACPAPERAQGPRLSAPGAHVARHPMSAPTSGPSLCTGEPIVVPQCTRL